MTTLVVPQISVGRESFWAKDAHKGLLTSVRPQMNDQVRHLNERLVAPSVGACEWSYSLVAQEVRIESIFAGEAKLTRFNGADVGLDLVVRL